MSHAHFASTEHQSMNRINTRSEKHTLNMNTSMMYLHQHESINKIKKYGHRLPPLYLCETATASTWILEPTVFQQMMLGALC